jgi:N-methylhydantoinase A/oxoprolinase/acetone carboxylase beta subunit
VAGLPVRLPMLDILTVGAGGGSIAWIDDGGALRVGPQSAGADPGPACYGRGGDLPTVTDANLVLGRLDAAVRLAGSVELDAKAARRAVARVADGFASVRAAAGGIVSVANQEMVRAIRVVSVERGHDPRRFELIAFGGAGPLHACEVAEELGMRSVLVPAASGVLSALGIAAGERRRDAVRSVMRSLQGLTRSQIRSQVPWPQAERGSARWAAADLRYAGQGFELEVDLEPLATLAERFHERHAERYGHEQRGTPIELINLRAASIAAGPELKLARAPRKRPVPGPATLHLDGATLWVAPGWTARGAGDGGWRVTR